MLFVRERKNRGDPMGADITKNLFLITEIRRVALSELPRTVLPFSTPRRRDALSYVVEGLCRHTLPDGTELVTQAGDVLYLAAGEDYRMEVESERYRYYICEFSFAGADKRTSFVVTPKPGTDAEGLFRRLKSTFSLASLPQRIACHAALYRIYAAVVESATARYIAGSAKGRVEAAHSALLARVTDPDLRVAALAKTAGMSEVHFRKLFYNLYGATPAAYLTRQRVAYAENLLTLPELRLEDVAIGSGFRSLPYFCKVFKTVTGTTPAAYRRAGIGG